ncbi:hypothetical protein ADUPG1_010621, partial [Aduncisulcus paluster]
MQPEVFIPTVPLFLANRVLEGIFVGSSIAAEDDDFVFSNEITYIINCCGTQCSNRFASSGVKYLSFPWLDSDSTIIFDAKDVNVLKIIEFLEEALKRDNYVLIHSRNGDSRAVIALAAFLVFKYHWPPQRALQFIATKRFNCQPRPNFIRQLIRWSEKLREAKGPFKDIFGDITGIKLNQEELLHRNSFLNAVQASTRPPPMTILTLTDAEKEEEYQYRVKLAQLEAQTLQEKTKRPVKPTLPTDPKSVSGPNRHIRWRDGQKSGQITHLLSGGRSGTKLFRGSSHGYSGDGQSVSRPVRVSFDILPGRSSSPTGSKKTPNTSAATTCPPPVSVLKERRSDIRYKEFYKGSNSLVITPREALSIIKDKLIDEEDKIKEREREERERREREKVRERELLREKEREMERREREQREKEGRERREREHQIHSNIEDGSRDQLRHTMSGYSSASGFGSTTGLSASSRPLRTASHVGISRSARQRLNNGLVGRRTATTKGDSAESTPIRPGSVPANLYS